ncbi:MAG TPA: hypothetical protein VGJ20_44950 [Xanthobacteraceae bacterium]
MKSGKLGTIAAAERSGVDTRKNLVTIKNHGECRKNFRISFETRGSPPGAMALKAFNGARRALAETALDPPTTAMGSVKKS